MTSGPAVQQDSRDRVTLSGSLNLAVAAVSHEESSEPAGGAGSGELGAGGRRAGSGELGSVGAGGRAGLGEGLGEARQGAECLGGKGAG